MLWALLALAVSQIFAQRIDPVTKAPWPLVFRSGNDGQDFYATSIAENPDTGDTAYGGRQPDAGKAFIGFKKGDLNKDMPENFDWLIKETAVADGNTLELEFTPSALSAFGNRRLLMAVIGSTTQAPRFFFLDPDTGTTPKYALASDILQQSAYPNIYGYYECVSTSYMYMEGTDLILLMTSCGTTASSSRAKFLKYFKFNASVKPMTTTETQVASLNRYSGAQEWVTKHARWTKSATKLYMATNSQYSSGFTSSCILTFALPYNPAVAQEATDCQQVGVLACGAKGYGCTMVKIGAIDYYDKIIAGMNYELTMQDNGTPAAASYPIAKVVGQCDATTMLQVEWWHTLNSADIRIIKAINSTDNYMGLYNTDASTNFKAGWYIIQVTFDPDPATCNASPATFKTPLKAKYIHAGDNLASINADVDSGVGYGGFKFFSKMNAFVVAGTLNQIRTKGTPFGTGKIGFVQAYGPGNPRPERGLGISVNGKWNSYATSSSYSIMSAFATIAPVASTVTFADLSTSLMMTKANIFGTCYGQITTLENATKFIFNTLTTLYWNPKTGATQTENIIKYEDLWKFHSTDPTCNAITTSTFQVHQQNSILKTDLTAITGGWQSPGQITTALSGVFTITTNMGIFYSNHISLQVVNHPCSTATPVKAASKTLNYIIVERVDGKGVAVASLPTDHPAITQVLLSNNMITLTKTLTECPVTWTLDVLNGAGAAITAYSSQISLATTTTEVTVTFSNYGSVDKVAWATVKVGLKADGTYFNQATLADMVLFSYQPHQCKAVLINFVTATPVVTLQGTYTKKISDFDQTPALIPSSILTLTDDIKTHLVSADATNCPITEFKLHDARNSTNATITDFTGFTVDNTGTLTVQGYNRLADGVYDILITATHGHNFFVDYNSRVITKLQVQRASNCLSALSSTPSTQIVKISYYVWKAESGDIISLPGLPVPQTKIDLATNNPISTNDLTNCPITQKRLVDAKSNTDQPVPLATISPFIKFDANTNLVLVADYSGANINTYNGLKVMTQSRTDYTESIPEVLFTISASMIECSKDDVLKAPAEVKLLEVTREVIEKSGIQTPVLSVDNKTLDMSSGFFDQAQVSNCSLNLYNLTKVMLNGVALLETDWAKFISFNTTEKKLTVFDYGRLVVDDQTEFKLLFQSRISATLPSLSDSYHLASVKVAKKVTILKSTSGGEVNNLPQFKEKLPPIVIIEDFKNRATMKFNKTDFQFPLVVDPSGGQLVPMQFVGIEKYNFISFDGDRNLTIDPNLINDTIVAERGFDFEVILANKIGNSSVNKVSVYMYQQFLNTTTVGTGSNTNNNNNSNSKNNNNKTNNSAQAGNNTKTETNSSNLDSASEQNATGEINASNNNTNATEETTDENNPKINGGGSGIDQFELKNNDKNNSFGFNGSKNQQGIGGDGEFIQEKPPQPPKLRKVQIGSVGDLKIEFNAEVFFPNSFYEKWWADIERRKHMGTIGPMEKRLLQDYEFFDFSIMQAVTNDITLIKQQDVYIENIGKKRILASIEFERPELISMRDQQENDQLQVGLNIEIMGANGVAFDPKQISTDSQNGELELDLGIQPMVNSESIEQQALEVIAEIFYQVGIWMMILQFLLTYILMISMSWFMDLIASQINFIYMPLLRVNAPGQVSFYLEILIFVCTFDPIPLDILYELMPFWNFDYVGVENDREAFPRIGLEDRNMVGVLGSMIFFMMVYVITQVIWHILRLFEDKHRYIPYLLSFIKKETLYRTIIVIFLLEAYLDLLLGGLLNTENDYLFEDPANWGINGELTTSDQFSILLGNVIYIATQLFPYAVMFLLQYKYEIRYQNKFMKNDFAVVYEILYDGFRTETYGPFQYYTVFLLRKQIFANLVYYLDDEAYTFFQILVNCALSLLFSLYLAHAQPFVDKTTNLVNLLNEVCFYMVSLLYFCFTDFNPDPEVKVMCGWFVMIVLVCNLIWPNGYIMVTGIWPEIKEKFNRRKRRYVPKSKWHARRDLIVARKEFIKDKMILKEEFQPKEEEEMREQPRKNQVVDLVFFPDLTKVDFYEQKAEKHEERKEINPLFVYKKPEKEPKMSVIDEASNEGHVEFSSSEESIEHARPVIKFGKIKRVARKEERN